MSRKVGTLAADPRVRLELERAQLACALAQVEERLRGAIQWTDGAALADAIARFRRANGMAARR